MVPVSLSALPIPSFLCKELTLSAQATLQFDKLQSESTF